MGNVFKKRKQSISNDESSKTTTDMPSACTHSEKSSDITTESNEGECSEGSNSWTDDEIEEILETGDLSRIHELDAWAAATIRTDELSEVSVVLAEIFIRFCKNSDGASLHALNHLPHFHLIASAIISGLDHVDLNDDPLFHAKLCDALLPHVRPQHEIHLRWCLRCVIEVHCPVSVLEFLDALWSNSMSNHSNDIQAIKMIYSEYLKEQNKDVTIITLIKSVIHTGISRHIRVMLDFINDLSHNNAFVTYSKSQLLEWALCSNLQINDIHILRHIDIESALSISICLKMCMSLICKLEQRAHSSNCDFEYVTNALLCDRSLMKSSMTRIWREMPV